MVGQCLYRNPSCMTVTALSLCACGGSGGSGVGSVADVRDLIAAGGLPGGLPDDAQGGLPLGAVEVMQPESQAARLACRSPEYTFDQRRYPNFDLLSFDTYQQPEEFVSLEQTIWTRGRCRRHE